LRAPGPLRRFFDENPVLEGTVAHIAGTVDIAEIIHALVALARTGPDWSLAKLVWLYEEARRRYGKRDTQRKILALLAENPDCFPPGHRLATKIASQTTRRFDVPIDSERMTAAFGQLWLKEWREAGLGVEDILSVLRDDPELPKDLPLAGCFAAVSVWLPEQSPEQGDVIWTAHQQMPRGEARDRLCLAFCRILAPSPAGSAVERLKQRIRELLGQWDGDPDRVKRFADGLHDAAPRMQPA
jgi:hypothetical protein